MDEINVSNVLNVSLNIRNIYFAPCSLIHLCPTGAAAAAPDAPSNTPLSTTHLDFMFGVISPAGGTYPGFALWKRVRHSRHSRSSVSLQQE